MRAIGVQAHVRRGRLAQCVGEGGEDASGTAEAGEQVAARVGAGRAQQPGRAGAVPDLVGGGEQRGVLDGLQEQFHGPRLAAIAVGAVASVGARALLRREQAEAGTHRTCGSAVRGAPFVEGCHQCFGRREVQPFRVEQVAGGGGQRVEPELFDGRFDAQAVGRTRRGERLSV